MYAAQLIETSSISLRNSTYETHCLRIENPANVILSRF